MQKRAAVIQDISCFGKCSASVALPVLSHFDIEAALLPTALFSAHTAFPVYSCRDLTDDMIRTAGDWRKLGLCFDGFYSGYMLSSRQIEFAADFICEFKKPDSLILVDPVMGDNGKAYSVQDADSRKSMAKLVSLAEVTTPNLTETAMLLDKKPVVSGYGEQYVRSCLLSLKGLGCETPIITGVSLQKGKTGAAYLENGQMKYICSKEYDGDFSGTGDVFASVVFSVLLQGGSVFQAVKKAVSVLDTAIKNSDVHYAPAFEKALGQM